MRYRGEEALGLVETVGLVPALKACDEMLKAANVELISYENIGSTLVTIMIKGDVAAVEASVAAGAKAAEGIGTLTAQKRQTLSWSVMKMWPLVTFPSS